MALCRVFVAVLLAGFMFLGMNVFLLWNQVPSPQPCPVCDCSGHQNSNSVSLRHVVDSPSSESSQESVLSSQAIHQKASLARLLNKTRKQEDGDPHQLAVIVPFRNRYEEMIEFVPHIHSFLERQNVKHKIWIINQVDTHRYVCCEHNINNECPESVT